MLNVWQSIAQMVFIKVAILHLCLGVDSFLNQSYKR